MCRSVTPHLLAAAAKPVFPAGDRMSHDALLWNGRVAAGRARDLEGWAAVMAFSGEYRDWVSRPSPGELTVV